MARSPYPILVFPYMKDESNSYLYALFRRSKEEYWQGIAGGGEEGESVLDSAKRESYEEAGIQKDMKYVELDSRSMLSVLDVVGKFMWGQDTYVIPEYCFGVKLTEYKLSLSNEHKEYKWVTYEEAIKMLKWDSNKTAIWELNKRLTRAKTL